MTQTPHLVCRGASLITSHNPSQHSGGEAERVADRQSDRRLTLPVCVCVSFTVRCQSSSLVLRLFAKITHI